MSNHPHTIPTPRRARLATFALLAATAWLCTSADASAGAARKSSTTSAPAVALRPASHAHLIPAATGRVSVGTMELLGETRLPAGGTILGTPLGGLSGLTYDPETGTYLAISDDRGNRAPARFYQLRIDLVGGKLTAECVHFTNVVTLTNADGQIFSSGNIDPEGIALSPAGTVFVSSEGDASLKPPVAPFVNEFGRDGRQLRALPIPAYFVPSGDGRVGVRNNYAFEPLAVSADGLTVLTGTEIALAQDGPAPTVGAGSPSRLMGWNLASAQHAFEVVYPVSPLPSAPSPADGYADNGLVEAVSLDSVGTLLTMERSFVAGTGTTIRLFETSLAGATDVSGITSLTGTVQAALDRPGAAGRRIKAVVARNDSVTREKSLSPAITYEPATKRQVADIGALGVMPDNIEGMTFGPTLPDGRRVLMLVSDDNFNPLQVTQFVALAVRLVVDELPSPFIYLPLTVRNANAESAMRASQPTSRGGR